MLRCVEVNIISHLYPILLQDCMNLLKHSEIDRDRANFVGTRNAMCSCAQRRHTHPKHGTSAPKSDNNITKSGGQPFIRIYWPASAGDAVCHEDKWHINLTSNLPWPCLVLLWKNGGSVSAMTLWMHVIAMVIDIVMHVASTILDWPCDWPSRANWKAQSHACSIVVSRVFCFDMLWLYLQFHLIPSNTWYILIWIIRVWQRNGPY